MKTIISDEERRKKRNAYQKKWDQKNPEKVKAIRRRSYQRRKVQINAKQRQYYQEHKEAHAGYSKKYRERHKDELPARKAEYYQKHKVRWLQKNKEWRIANRELVRHLDWAKVLKRLVPRASFFYIIRFGEFIKVGVAINWERRKSEYEGHNPIPMEIIHCEWSEKANVLEHVARGELRPYFYRRNEWFKNIPDEILGDWLKRNL